MARIEVEYLTPVKRVIEIPEELMEYYQALLADEEERTDEEWDLVETIGYWTGLVGRITGETAYELEINNILDKQPQVCYNKNIKRERE